jgi:hypothetical protein
LPGCDEYLRRKRLRADRRFDHTAGHRDCTIAEMNDALRRRVKYLIIVVANAPEEISRKLLAHDEILF